jgi:hypothetical protein
MKCPSCGCECERGMRLTFRLHGYVHDGQTVQYLCVTAGIGGHINLPAPLEFEDAAPELTVYIEGAG